MIWTYCPVCLVRTDHKKVNGKLICTNKNHDTYAKKKALSGAGK